MGSLLVVTGPPGAGKSTVARILADQVEPSVLIEGDQFFAFLGRGAVEPWLPEAHHQNTVVVSAAAAAAGRFAAARFKAIYDGVVRPWSLPTFAASTGLREFDYVVLMPTVEVCARRVMTRTAHGFRDEAAARNMHDEFMSADINGKHLLAVGGENAQGIAHRVASAREIGQLAFKVPAA